MRVFMPETLSEAVAYKAAHPQAVPMAGGTDLLVCWPEALDRHDQTYIDMWGLDELRSMRWTDATLELGALTTYWDVLQDERVGREFSLLQEAARTVGAVQIQARGTWAGNIANASPAADGVPVLMAYDAVVVLVSAAGSREVPLSEFYHGYKELESTAEELIEKIVLPRRKHNFFDFIKVGPRRAQAITKVGTAIAHSDTGWRVVANSVAPTVCRCPRLERLLEEQLTVRGPDDLLEAIRQDVSPIDDIRSTARYREKVMSRILYYALRDECPSFH